MNIEVKSKIKYSGKEDEKFEFITECEVIDHGIYKEIKYREPDVEDLPSSDVSIKVYNDYIQIKRTGAINSDIVLDEKNNSECEYETPFGHFNLFVKTKEIRINELNISSIYMLSFDGSEPAEHVLDIKVFEEEKRQ